MKTLIDLLQGNHATAKWIYWFLGVLGVLLGILSHFGTFHSITVGNDKSLIVNGLDAQYGSIALGILFVYGLLIIFRSVYIIIPALLFFVYMLEQVIGLHFLRFMPLESTKLFPALYLGLPLTALLLLLGAFACFSLSKKE